MVEESRKFYLRRAEIKIQTNLKNITHNESTIISIKSSLYSSEYISNQILKCNNKISELTIENIDLQKEIIDIHNGLYDDEIQKSKKQSNDESKEKFENKKLNKENKQKEKKERIIQKAINKKNRKFDTPQEWEMDKALKYFYSVCDTIPENISSKLAIMPNNKGYIWRGVYLYGTQPSENNDQTVLFERKGAKTLIHEWSKTRYNIYEKIGQNPKNQISSTIRRIIK